VSGGQAPSDLSDMGETTDPCFPVESELQRDVVRVEQAELLDRLEMLE
jgi:hypothetical protein